MNMGLFNGIYKLRWGVLNRDHFTCQYCGQSAPAVKLEIGHIIAIVNGGKTESDNLITSCYACNRGKRDELTVHKSNIPKMPKKSLVSLCIAYITSYGAATASQISKVIKKNRANVSTTLNRHQGFVKIGKKGRDVYFGLREEF